MPADDVSLAVLGEAVGLPGTAFAVRVDWDQTHRAYEAALTDAVKQGVFGVPTFVTEGGELIFLAFAVRMEDLSSFAVTDGAGEAMS